MTNVVAMPLSKIDLHELKVQLMEMRMANEAGTDRYSQVEAEIQRRQQCSQQTASGQGVSG